MLFRTYHSQVILLHFTPLSTFGVVCIYCIHAGCTIWCCVTVTAHSVTMLLQQSGISQGETIYTVEIGKCYK